MRTSWHYKTKSRSWEYVIHDNVWGSLAVGVIYQYPGKYTCSVLGKYNPLDFLCVSWKRIGEAKTLEDAVKLMEETLDEQRLRTFF